MREPEKRDKQKDIYCLMGIMENWQINTSEGDIKEDNRSVKKNPK